MSIMSATRLNETQSINQSTQLSERRNCAARSYGHHRGCGTLLAGLAAQVVLLAGAMGGVVHASATSLTMSAGAERGARSPAAIIAGRTLFNRNCQMCHNQRGVGGKCPTLVRGAWAPGGPNGAAFMFATITDGRPGTEMPSWGPVLTPAQIREIVVYLRHEALVIAAQDRERARHSHFERRP